MTTYVNEDKNSTNYENDNAFKPPALYGRARFGMSRFGITNVANTESYDNEDKNSTNYTNETPS